MQKLVTGWSDCRVLSSKWDIYINQIRAQKRTQKKNDCKSWKIKRRDIKFCLLNDMTTVVMNTRELWLPAWDMHTTILKTNKEMGNREEVSYEEGSCHQDWKRDTRGIGAEYNLNTSYTCTKLVFVLFCVIIKSRVECDFRIWPASQCCYGCT